MEFTAEQVAGAVERLSDGLQIEHCFAEVHGERLHYVRAGKGDPIVFLHGFPQFWYSWRYQLAEFASDHLVIAADLRGYNLSSKPKRPQRYAMSLLVEDLRALVEHLELPPFTLVGHDWGGLVGWAFAIIYPERLQRLVITTASHPTLLDRAMRQDPEQQEASQFTFLLAESGIEEALMRYYQGPWERGDVGVLDETYTDDFIGHAFSFNVRPASNVRCFAFLGDPLAHGVTWPTFSSRNARTKRLMSSGCSSWSQCRRKALCAPWWSTTGSRAICPLRMVAPALVTTPRSSATR